MNHLPQINHVLFICILSIFLPVFSNDPMRVMEKTYNHEQATDVIVLLKEPSITSKLNSVSALTKAKKVKSLQEWRDIQEDAQTSILGRMKKLGFNPQPKHRYNYLLNGFAMTLKQGDLEKVRAIPGVARVLPDTVCTIYQNTSVSLINAPQVWELKDSQDRALLGEGVVIAIIDTGVDYNHPDLGSGFGPGFKVSYGYDFVNEDSDPMDDHNHGTHVAGIAAANGQMVGVAPLATIHAYKAMGSDGTGLTSDIVKAIEHAVDPDGDPLTDDGANIINMSLGGPGDANSPISLAAEAAVQAGVFVAVAAGNDGPQGDIGQPGLAPSVLTVASSSGSQPDSFSTCGKGPETAFKPEIAAPGNRVWSTEIGGGHHRRSGTSMAAPHIAGAAALLLQADPSWSPQRLKRFMVNHTDHISPANAICLGAGLINLSYVATPKPVELESPILWFGKVDITADEVRLVHEIVAHNTSDIPQTVASLEVGSDSEEGLAIIPGEALTLQPGGSGRITQTLNIDNTKAPFSLGRGGVNLFSMALSNADQNISMVGAYRKAFQISFEPEFEGDYIVVIDSDEFDNAFIEAATDPAQITTFAGPGSYKVSTVGISPLQGEPKVWIQKWDVELDPENPADVVITDSDRDQLGSLEISMTGIDGVPMDLQSMKHQQHFSLQMVENFNLTLMFNGSDLVDVQVQDKLGFPINMIGYARDPGRKNFFGFNAFFDGESNVNPEVSVDLRDSQKVSWIDFGNGRDPQTGPGVVMAQSTFFGMGVLPGVTTDGPGPYALTTWEQVYDDLLAIHPREMAMRLSFSPYGLSGYYVFTGDGLMTEVNPDTLEPIRTLRADRILTGASPVFSDFGILARDVSPAFEALFSTFDAMRDSGGGRFEPRQEATLTLPGGRTLTGHPQNIVQQIGPPLMGDYSLTIEYDNMFRGQTVPATYKQSFTLEPGVVIEPIRVETLRLLRDGALTDIITGSETLELRFDGALDPDSLDVAFNLGEGWVAASFEIKEDGLIHVATPVPFGASRIGLRIIAMSLSGSNFELEMPQVYAGGFRKLLPWIASNDIFKSRIALTNTSDLSERVDLIARDREGTVSSKIINLEPQSVQSFAASELFDLNGYNLTVVSESNQIHPAFLTLAQRENQEPSPAQSSGVTLMEPSAHINFGNLETDQIPAVVISAPFQEATPERETMVTLEFRGAFRPPIFADITLFGAQPFAATLQTIFPDGGFPDGTLAENGWLLAHAPDQTRISGAVFGFNQGLEPSMTHAVDRFHLPGDLIFPWLVSNERWESELGLINLAFYDRQITLKANTANGECHERTLDLLGGEIVALSVDELFPDLTAYSLSIDASGANISASLRTINKNTPSGDSPAKVSAIQGHEATGSALFSYLAGDQVPAIVLTAPWATRDVEVELVLLGPAGVLDQTRITINGPHPFASVVGDLFSEVSLPSDLAIIARAINGEAIIGTSFTFNRNGEPSMAKTNPL